MLHTLFISPEEKKRELVNGPGHVSTNYTLSYNKSYLNFKTEYLHSVSFKIKPIKYLMRVKNYIAKI